MMEFTVKRGDVLREPADLLLLKHAQGFFGADRAVASTLIEAALCMEEHLRLLPGQSVVVETKGTIAPERVLFLGTPPVSGFTYDEMEVFARRAIDKIADLGLPVRMLTSTVHGPGYGLDAGEALQRLVLGFQMGLSMHRLPEIERITFVTPAAREERFLSAALAAMPLSARDILKRIAAGRSNHPVDRPTPPTDSPAGAVHENQGPYGRPAVLGARKRRVFVALPFSEDFENVYEFGIYPAVRNCGFICERVDEVHFTGDVLSRIRAGIETADLVIADLTQARPNVYLEVGYAWGRGIPVIFVAKKGQRLHFDVSTHRCIFYGKYAQFSKDLENLLRGIVEGGRP